MTFRGAMRSEIPTPLLSHAMALALINGKTWHLLSALEQQRFVDRARALERADRCRAKTERLRQDADT